MQLHLGRLNFLYPIHFFGLWAMCLLKKVLIGVLIFTVLTMTTVNHPGNGRK